MLERLSQKLKMIPTAPRHPAAQDPHSLLRQQDGHAGLHVLGQGLADPRPGAHHGQGTEKNYYITQPKGEE